MVSNAITLLKEERQKIDNALRALLGGSTRKPASRTIPTPKPAVKTAPMKASKTRGHKMSPAAREKISKAMKLRWKVVRGTGKKPSSPAVAAA